MATTTARLPILGFQHPSKFKVGSTPGVGFAVMVWSNLTDTSNHVQLPSAARPRRLAGVNNQNHVAGVVLSDGDQIPLGLSRESEVLLRPPTGGETSIAVLQGDWLVPGNTAGHVEPYIPGTGTVEIIGASREKLVNATTGPVNIVAQIGKFMAMQAMEVYGFTRAITANNTKFIGADATELSAVETLFVAPFDGVLQGPFTVDIEPSGGVPAGTIVVTVQYKAPGGAWADLLYDGVNPWIVTLAPTGIVTHADDTAANLPYGRTVAVLKGTKIGFKSVKDVAVANVAQLSTRVAFV
jgi:hypothetical protein